MTGLVMWVACLVNLAMFTRRKFITHESQDERKSPEEEERQETTEL